MKVCMNATTVKQKENYFSVATNCTEIRIFFLTDYIIRIRAGFDGDFAEDLQSCYNCLGRQNGSVFKGLP